MSLELPEDVLREIFEWALAGGACGRKWKADCYGLALVSKQLQSIVEPILYGEIDITSASCCEVIDRTIRHHPAKPSDFFVVNVKYIRVNYLSEDVTFIDALRRILVACKGIQKYENTIEVRDNRPFRFGPATPKLAHTLHVSVPPPKHLTISEHAFSPRALDFNPQIFTNVTHLCLCGRDELGLEYSNFAQPSHPPQSTA